MTPVPGGLVVALIAHLERGSPYTLTGCRCEGCDRRRRTFVESCAGPALKALVERSRRP